MTKRSSTKYSITLGFEEIKLPPFEDILVVGSKSPQGKEGVAKLFEFLIPDQFEAIEMDDPKVEVVFINRKIWNKIDKKNILPIIQQKIIPFISPIEILKVDCKLNVNYHSINMELGDI